MLWLFERKRLWSNSGAAVLPVDDASPVVTGVNYWFKPSVTPGTFISNGNIPTAAWYKCDTQDADAALLVFNGRILNIGTITAIAASNLAIAAQGKPYIDSDTDFDDPEPARILNAPSGNNGQPNFSMWPITQVHGSMQRLNDDAGLYNNQTAQGGTVSHRGAIFIFGGQGDSIQNFGGATRDPAVDERPGWQVWLQAKSSHNTGDHNQRPHPPLISGIKRLWIAVSMFNTWTAGGGPSLRLKAAMDLLLFKHVELGVEDVDKRRGVLPPPVLTTY